MNPRRPRRDGIVIVDVARAKAAPTMKATTRGITWLVLDSSVGVMKPSRQTGTGRSLDLDDCLLLGGSDVNVAASTDDDEGNDDSTDTPRVVMFQVIASTGDIVADGTCSEATVGGATGERPDALQRPCEHMPCIHMDITHRSECETSPAMSRRCGTAASMNIPMGCGTYRLPCICICTTNVNRASPIWLAIWSQSIAVFDV